jgi:hypothetical protein
LRSRAYLAYVSIAEHEMDEEVGSNTDKLG